MSSPRFPGSLAAVAGSQAYQFVSAAVWAP